MKIHRTLFVRKNVPIFAVVLALLGFFGIRFDSVKSVIQDKSRPLAAGEPFFCTLKDEADIENKGGDVHINSSEKSFLPGECRDGFVSKESRARVTFPVDGKFTYLKAGTIELCLTPLKDFFTTNKDLYLFNTAQSHNAIMLQVAYPKERGDLEYPSFLRLRVKKNDGKKKNSRVRSRNGVEWKVGRHYHIAGTWGENGLRLYIDGKDVGTRTEDEGYKGPPENLIGNFVVNNGSPDEKECNEPTHCIISNLVIHEAQLDPKDLGKKCPMIRRDGFPEK